MIHLKDIVMTYYDNGTKIDALKLKEIQIEKGKQVAFVGSSGCGKTTLFNLISGMIVPTEGEVWIEKEDITRLPELQRDLFRANHIGYIFQDFNLFPEFTAIQNVLLPMSFSKANKKSEMIEKARDILNKVGMNEKMNQKVKTLSGGEKQRVAIARSIVNRPDIILADEPTGNLDYKNGIKIMELLQKLAKEENTTLLVITHNQSQFNLFDAIINVEELNEAIR